MSQISKLIRQNKKKIKAFDTKLKTSFILIRQDLDDMQIIIEAMKKYLKKKDTEYENQNKYTIKAQAQIQKNIEEFDEKISQLKLALSQITAIKQEVVLRKHLAQIEDRIKISFKNEVEKYKSQAISLRQEVKESQKRIKALEKGVVRNQKKSWFKKTKL
jgi:predicted RNase H-like nuclease (RuvC/YqgF family)